MCVKLHSTVWVTHIQYFAAFIYFFFFFLFFIVFVFVIATIKWLTSVSLRLISIRFVRDTFRTYVLQFCVCVNFYFYLFYATCWFVNVLSWFKVIARKMFTALNSMRWSRSNSVLPLFFCHWPIDDNFIWKYDSKWQKRNISYNNKNPFGASVWTIVCLFVYIVHIQ